MPRMVRPPYVIAFPGDLAGCGRHRIMRPLEIMGRSGYLAGRAESRFVQDHLLQAIKPDVIVFQRQCDDNQYEVMKRYRALLPDAFFVFEIDDALSAVPESSWHRPYMTPNIDSKLRRAIALCDVVTVTTEDLREHMLSICEPGTRVRLVPNMLGKDELELVTQVRKEILAMPPTQPTSSDKLRVGWGGGIGHAGDLALLNEVFLALKDEVEWVFLGMEPETPPNVTKSFMGATSPERYLPSLAAINVDLIVAPLEDNLFNRCKSNLRLIEAGICNYPVIASSVAPYLTDSPPVFSYANTTDEWVSSIRAFKALSPEQRAQHATALHQWVKSRYIMDDHVEKRVLAWLPEETRVFKPKLNHASAGLTIVSSIPIKDHTVEHDIVKACTNSSDDILYIREGTYITDSFLSRLKAAKGDVLCPLSNEAGPWGFPNASQFSPLDTNTYALIDKLCADMPKLASGDLIDLAAISGPVVLLRRSALAAIGCPDFESYASTELAILEWSVTAKARGLKTGLFPHAFAAAAAPSRPDPKDAEVCALRISNRWPQSKNDDAALTALREYLEINFHREHYTALPPTQRQDYPLWVDLCDTRGPRMIDAAWDWEESQFTRVSADLLDYPCAVPENIDAEWLFFKPAKARQIPDWLPIFHKALQDFPEAKIFYADHDFFDKDDKPLSPDFKPNLDIQMLLARDYVSQGLIVHKSLVVGKTITASSLYALVLNQIANSGPAIIAHIPHRLVSLPLPDMGELTATAPERLQAAQDFCKDFGFDTLSLSPHPTLPWLHHISYRPRNNIEPSVAIIVPTKNKLELLAPCIASILTVTKYSNYHITIIDNGSDRQEHLDYLASLTDPRITVLRWPETYNWSSLNNWAVDNLPKPADFYCFLNDDTRVMSPVWLSEMVGAAQLPNIGSVGARLVYPHGQIQHIGVAAHKGMTGHIHKGLPLNQPGTNFYAALSHEATCATGACLVVSKESFSELHGFDERFAHNFNDVVFGIELNRRGYRTIIANNAELQHFEGVTRNDGGFNDASRRWLYSEGELLGTLYPDEDPYWNPNLLMTAFENGALIAGMDLATYAYPPPALPWQDKVTKKRVLVVGPSKGAAMERHDQCALFYLHIADNQARIVNPPMYNCGPWDIRRPEIAAKALASLGLSEIILTGLDEAPLQTLQFLKHLNLPIIYRPLTAEAACPRGNLMAGEVSCNKGYARQQCQSCVDKLSSPQGQVSMFGWLASWMRFFEDNVLVDLTNLPDTDHVEALGFIYGNTSIQEAAE
jgi:GT2 family glycosyltransferase